MDFFFKIMIFCIVVFFVWILFSVWLFVMVEYIEKDEVKEKDQLLFFLFKVMVFKYNMIEEDFKNFFSIVFEVLSKFSFKWMFLVFLIFVVQVIIIVGKIKYVMCLNYCKMFFL